MEGSGRCVPGPGFDAVFVLLFVAAAAGFDTMFLLLFAAAAAAVFVLLFVAVTPPPGGGSPLLMFAAVTPPPPGGGSIAGFTVPNSLLIFLTIDRHTAYFSFFTSKDTAVVGILELFKIDTIY